MIKLKDILNEILREGGVGGHIDHPFDFAATGPKLVDVFVKTIKSLKKGTGSVKIDGINASIRLSKNKFVMDRGTARKNFIVGYETDTNGNFVLDKKGQKVPIYKQLDVLGVRPEDLPFRFPPDEETNEPHGFVKSGTKVIEIFDKSILSTKSELKSLGLIGNPNILLNIEYVEGKTNVVGYEGIGNFLAIHGLKEIKPETFTKDGKIKSREAYEITYDKNVMQSYINKLNKVALKFGFKVLGSVDTTFKSEPDLGGVLNETVTLYPTEIAVSKSLKDWLKTVKITTPLITRKIFIQASNSKNISEEFKNQDVNKIINDTIVYIATIKLGDEILRNCTSEIGDLEKHEGIVIRDPSIYSDPYKITGSFIIKGLESSFRK